MSKHEGWKPGQNAAWDVPCQPFALSGGGCTLRDLLAIQAPPEPYWFQPVMETDRPNGGTPEEIQSWERECAIQTTAQWPWAYADLVLSARKGGAT